MIANDLINSSTCDGEGHTIEPIELIEVWGLCCHLACVVKCLVSSERKRPTLKDLRKADWYLNQELEQYEKVLKPCLPELSQEPSFAIDAVLEDWKLSSNLENVLVNILNSRKGSPPGQEEIMTIYNQYIPLSKALGYLRVEIAECEKMDS